MKEQKPVSCFNMLVMFVVIIGIYFIYLNVITTKDNTPPATEDYYTKREKENNPIPQVIPVKTYSSSELKIINNKQKLEEERRVLKLLNGSKSKYKRYLKLHNTYPSWEEDVLISIVKKQVSIGMTKAQVISSWGKPDDINRTVSSYSTHEQWIYGELNATYLYFEDGIMTSFQD